MDTSEVECNSRLLNRLLCLLLFGTHLSAAHAQQIDGSPAPDIAARRRTEAFRALPPPPEGFSWQPFKNVAFLRPDGWSQNTLESDQQIPMHVFAVGPQPFSKEHLFETGLTVQIIDSPQKMAGLDAYKAVLAYLKPFADAHKNPSDTILFDQQQKGEVQLTYWRFRDAPAGQKPIIVHKYILASKQFDSVYIFTFESPQDNWDENWRKYGTPILKMPVVFVNMPISEN